MHILKWLTVTTGFLLGSWCMIAGRLVEIPLVKFKEVEIIRMPLPVGAFIVLGAVLLAKFWRVTRETTTTTYDPTTGKRTRTTSVTSTLSRPDL